MTQPTLPAFTPEQFELARKLLAAQVSTMLGRKMEEADWDFVYCNAKLIPLTTWSNLHIDVNYQGLGVEHKMLRVTRSGSILAECGTSKMHPAGTRSIRIPDIADATLAARNILAQYGENILAATRAVQELTGTADMRSGWLLWKDGLDEFLYWETRLAPPNPQDYTAEWNLTPARGSRKASRSLWIYERATGNKRYSITTEAGAKVQPYFDVPLPSDPNLYHFIVQGVLLNGGLVEVWLSKSTARYLELVYGSLSTEDLSRAIMSYNPEATAEVATVYMTGEDIAVPVQITVQAYRRLRELFTSTSDEGMMQKFAHTFRSSINR